MLYTVFGNPASKQLNDPVWGGTTKQFQNHLAVARYFNEEMGVATETLATLRGVIGNVTPDTDVSTIDKIVQIIGNVPPGGERSYLVVADRQHRHGLASRQGHCRAVQGPRPLALPAALHQQPDCARYRAAQASSGAVIGWMTAGFRAIEL
jgi:hypothetical protein